MRRLPVRDESAARAFARCRPLAHRPRTRERPPSGVDASSAAMSSLTARSRASSTRSAFVSATAPCANAEQFEDRDVLARLRHHAVVGRDDEQREIDAARASDHRVYEAFVPGHIDETEHVAACERHIRVAELDRGCRALFSSARRSVVDARERAHERRTCRGRCGRPCRRSCASQRFDEERGSTAARRMRLRRIRRDSADRARAFSRPYGRALGAAARATHFRASRGSRRAAHAPRCRDSAKRSTGSAPLPIWLVIGAVAVS